MNEVRKQRSVAKTGAKGSSGSKDKSNKDKTKKEITISQSANKQNVSAIGGAAEMKDPLPPAKT
jgi:hypothetical protein